MTRSEEDALMDRDESVAAKLRAHIVGSRERAQQLRDAARSLERQAREESAEADRVEAAARDETTWRPSTRYRSTTTAGRSSSKDLPQDAATSPSIGGRRSQKVHDNGLAPGVPDGWIPDESAQ